MHGEPQLGSSAVRAIDCLTGAPVMESTSSSEAHPPSEGIVMQETSASESDRGPPNGRGCGRGHGRGRGGGSAASSSSRPKPRGAIRKPRGRNQKKSTLAQLQQPRPNRHDSMEETSVSDERARIAAAAKRTRTWRGDASEVTSSDEMVATPAASDSHSMPNSSGVFDYATWLVGRLTAEQRQKLTHSFTWMDLCAGLGTSFVAYEALRRALLPHGLSPAGECQGLTEMSDSTRAALRRRIVHGPNSPPSSPAIQH